ncbi:cation efflux family protein [Cladorrhinum sp. PSN332]|nr:cation efflux family protein [Cladorrhinum sp. PSN332]
MENHLLRSITFHPHWWGYHLLPGLGERKKRVARDIALPSFRAAHENNDPFGLLSAYKEPDALKQSELAAKGRMGPGAARGWRITCGWPCFIRSHLAGSWHARRVRHFYENQNATIERLLQTVEEHQVRARTEAAAEALRFKIAVYGSLAANIVLSGVQLFAAVTSGSLSLITTMADAVFDPLSNVILIAANRATHSVNPRRFPSGRARLETVGNIVFCFLMLAVSFVLIAFSVRDIAERSALGGVREFHLSAVIAAITSFITKFCLFLSCFTLRNRYKQVHIVWQDHRNDLLINGFGILTSVGGAKVAWWIDPAGAIVLSISIAVLWCRTAFAEFMLVVGVAASAETQQFITYVSLTHSRAITGIDTVRVYHSGPRLIVEVDVVMEKTTQLHVAHDVSEALQYKLESLPGIERTYVHVDYETRHKPEHWYIKRL